VPRPATARRTLSALLTLALVATLLVGTAPARAAAAPACDRAALIASRLDELGRDGFAWRLGTTPPGSWGWASAGRGVTVSETVPCDSDLIVSIVNHEWMHTQQYRAYPERSLRARVYGKAIETVADCGSMLLGSTVTPYLDERARDTCRAVAGCTPFELGAARRLLSAAGR